MKMEKKAPKKRFTLKAMFATAAACLVGGLGAGAAAGDYNSSSIEQATVSHTITDRKSGERVVYTDQGTYTNNDSYMKMKFNSDDIAKELKPGCTYQFNVHGWRSDLLGAVPNIDSITFVPTLECPKAPAKFS